MHLVTVPASLDGALDIQPPACSGATGRFAAFDALSIDGEDLRAWPLVERKRRLRAIMPRMMSRLLYLDHVDGRGVDLFREVCQRDLEGIVAKWRFGGTTMTASRRRGSR